MFEILGQISDAIAEVLGTPDTRTATWFTIRTPRPLYTLITSYLIFVLLIGPRYMKNRPAYNLKTFIIIYNLFQVIACSYLIYEFYQAGWRMDYLWKCYKVDFTDNHGSGMKMVNTIWYTLILKALELSETVVFVLRKKQNQVSVLHLYHHLTTLSIVWLFSKFDGGGPLTFGFVINLFIHIIMYTYYLLASLKVPQIEQYKCYLTLSQMVQFVILIINTTSAYLIGNCIRAISFYLTNTFLVIMFFLFFNFYKKAYGNKKVKKN